MANVIDTALLSFILAELSILYGILLNVNKIFNMLAWFHLQLDKKFQTVLISQLVVIKGRIFSVANTIKIIKII